MKKIKVKFSDGLEYSFFSDILSKRYDVELSDNPDFLFYNCHGFEHARYRDCVKIFVTNECCVPNFNECDYAISHSYLDFGDRHLRMPYYYWHMDIPAGRRNPGRETARRKFCNFVYTNFSGGDGALLRRKFCEMLMKKSHVDCPGTVLKNMDNAIEPRGGNWEAGKIDFLRNYKFTIAFENIGSDGYTTEKLIHPFMAGSIPIYWGNPRVGEEFNTKSFINCNDYGNDFGAVIEKIMELDGDDEKYLAMLSESPYADGAFKSRPSDVVGDFLYGIIDRGRQKRIESVGISDWGRTSVSKYIFYGIAMRLARGDSRKYYRRKFYNMRGDIKF